jgi:hypothetical protein
MQCDESEGVEHPPAPEEENGWYPCCRHCSSCDGAGHDVSCIFGCNDDPPRQVTELSFNAFILGDKKIGSGRVIVEYKDGVVVNTRSVSIDIPDDDFVIHYLDEEGICLICDTPHCLIA